jgi:predicted ester cyclase
MIFQLSSTGWSPPSTATTSPRSANSPPKSDEEWAPWERAFRDFFTAFPDYRLSVQHSVLGDSSFALFYEVTATHSAEFPAAELKGIPASGKTLTWNEAVYQEVRDGKITNGHLVIDGLARLRQLGVVPATENEFPE